MTFKHYTIILLDPNHMKPFTSTKNVTFPAQNTNGNQQSDFIHGRRRFEMKE